MGTLKYNRMRHETRMYETVYILYRVYARMVTIATVLTWQPYLTPTPFYLSIDVAHTYILRTHIVALVRALFHTHTVFISFTESGSHL